MYPFLLYVHLYCFLNRKAKGRQVADPYGGELGFTKSFLFPMIFLDKFREMI